MEFLQQMRSPRLSFIQTVVSLFTGGIALMSSHWCTGQQKVPKPLCSPIKHSNCIPVPGVSNSTNIQFSWETGDDRFVFPVFHTGLFLICEEDIYADSAGKRGRWVKNMTPIWNMWIFCRTVRSWLKGGNVSDNGITKERQKLMYSSSLLHGVLFACDLPAVSACLLGTYEKCRGFHTLTPGSEKASSPPPPSAAMMWLSLSLEILYVGLLVISCTLLSVQLCIRAWCPSTQRWGQLLNAFAAIFTVLGGLLGMVGHMMFMQVFQTTASMGPEDFKPHSYGYSWAFYVAWFAFTVCMSAGVSTLNNYTENVLMMGPRYSFNTYSFNFVGLLPPYYTPAYPAIALACPPSPPRISHLSPYYEPSTAALPASSLRLAHSHSLPLPRSDTFPPPPSRPAPASPFHRFSLPSPCPSPVHLTLPGHQESHYGPEEDYSPL
ncbi:germ cell-specific gene 1 protein [Anarhichas minor]|uniref:germ cell-specific gene 1 protein n=1 Tax=Anarhichas minor TaxID=65739 RepID=UPI003F7394D9